MKRALQRRTIILAEVTDMNQAMRPVALWMVGVCTGLIVGAAAFKVQAAPTRKYINIPHPIQAPFSDAVQVGDTVYLAGHLGFDQSNKIPADPADEAKVILEDTKKVLAEAGMTMDDLVSVQVFCTDLSLFDAWNRVYRGYFGKDLPARAFIGAGSLLRGAHFEMQGIAVRR
jgi:2-iminobutanoate/2-iminopropanoate deaminase